MIRFTLKPYDVLFFGSGRPFNRGDVVASAFPPHPNTFASAICSKIYQFKNIDISGILKSVYGPFISKEDKIYFPKPQNIYGEKKKKEKDKFFTVKPIDESKLNLFKSDNTNKPNGIKNLPVYLGDKEVEQFEGFISTDGLKKWLDNQEIKKEDILQHKDIFENEPRIGIKVEPSLYSVGGREDALYRIEFLRLKEDIKFVFWVEFDFSNRELKKCGLDDEKEIFEFFSNEPKVLKLGGEMKNVSYEVQKNDFKEWIRNELKFPEKIELKKEDKILVLFLTYGVFDGEKLPQINGFEIYSACFGSYEIIGINSAKMGRKTKRAFAPGTVLWLESQIDATINNPSFLCKNQSQNDYYFNEPKGKQEFIGTNLVLIKKEGGHKNV